MDISVRKGSEVILTGAGPTAHEIVAIGPGNIAAYGRDLTVHVSSSSPGGNTWSVKATEYVAE